MGFLDRIKTGIRLTIRSIFIVRNNRTLLWFPVLMLLVFAALVPVGILGFLGTMIAGAAAGVPEDNAEILAAAYGFVVYLVVTFISTYFSTALVHASHTIFKGGAADIRSSLRAAWNAAGTIFVWSLIAATVGLIIQRLEQRSPWISTLLSAAWAALTFFIVPVIALEETSIRGMFRRSAEIFRQRWGETAVGVAGTGIVQFAIALVGGGFVAAAWFLLGIEWLAVGLAIITALIAFLAGTTISGVVKTALYLHARDEGLPDEMAGIDPDALVQYRGGQG